MEALNLTGNYNIKNRPVRFKCAGTLVKTYNAFGEVESETLGGNAFNFAFDEIGNQTQFACNATNETTIEGDFVPAYDADGNATLIKTATGTWSVSCNGENRPVRFENAGTEILSLERRRF